MNNESSRHEFSWLDDAGLIVYVIIGIIVSTIILSQSFAINNNLGAYEILNNVINHNSIYLLSLIYFVSLKTAFGKKYFNYLNLFLIILYLITSITSLLTIFQTFSLTSLISLTLNISLFTYLFHMFFRRTRVWKEFKLDKSPFNDITNDAYFYIVVILAVILLSLNLILATSVDGVVVTMLDTLYIIMFGRYIYLYGLFLEKKEKTIFGNKDLSAVKDATKELVDDIISKGEVVASDVKDIISDVEKDVKKGAVKKTTTKKSPAKSATKKTTPKKVTAKKAVKSTTSTKTTTRKTSSAKKGEK